MSVKNSVRNFGMANGGARYNSDSFSQAADWLKHKKAEIAREYSKEHIDNLKVREVLFPPPLFLLNILEQ